MSAYCEGKECSKRDRCKKHLIYRDGEIHQYIDYSGYGSGTYTDNKCEIDHWCGDKGNFKLFEPDDDPEESCTPDCVPYTPEEVRQELDKICNEIRSKHFFFNPSGRTYCEGNECNKRDTCQYHCIGPHCDHAITIIKDYSTEHDTYIDANNNRNDIYHCGNRGEYFRYKEVKKTVESTLNKDVFTSNYKDMWNVLSNELIKMKNYYHYHDNYLSAQENVYGESVCSTILSLMDEIKTEFNRSNING